MAVNLVLHRWTDGNRVAPILQQRRAVTGSKCGAICQDSNIGSRQLRLLRTRITNSGKPILNSPPPQIANLCEVEFA